ncbi:pyrimidine 5'-nucleotidase [Actinobacillus pleuropneumoniae]|uniref:Pyrimidine 5'-nucleotidase n=4 Tax=Actinobacillus pleuropneumoniae TaxID=715 RepID=A0A9Q4DFM0_ACTPL|nr:pyrimidine 5'-nucleotidase [Actinobacillus pleuropneumoniae]ACE60786.1 putative haloacid dehalogenase-like hydrolase [Actinobacillus pleuropneumoniae serovar 7 str. AP76]ASU16052.1 Pyrimidine 5'-nucleotidase YjjG [Actinobacillus pleuropneumoniae]AWG94548.1 dUMP phosphatase [Actinobacillus pleuropneumoniae serovar 1 str. 4074]AXA20621.1 dUMP phosphatase [Actinobacillus pleuropneumoniae]EFL81555.1 nucleotidase [Actinobacillus pleuropneumoniae serovar 6 str. Femo]
MKYDWVLFDADETLFSFNSYLGLTSMLKRYGIEFTREDYEAFQAVNKPLWVAYQNNEITAQDIQTRRFAKLSAQTGIDALQLNQELMAEMALVSKPLDGVMAMLEQLYGKVKMGIITNGFTELQQKRLANTHTEKFFEIVVVSEQIGAAKPDRQVFDYAFTLMEQEDKTKVLMVGDTLASDVLGGNNAGIDTCWFNHSKSKNETQIRPTYEISSMDQLIEIVKGTE